MKISKATNAFKLGEFITRTGHANKISLQYLSSISQEILTDEAPRIYLIVVDGEIKKIGGSASKGGIKATMSFYTGSMTGHPGPVRYVIHRLIERELLAGKKVELYMIISPKVVAQVFGLSKVQNLEIASFKESENLAKSEYLEFDGRYPDWNFQENSTNYPEDLFADWLAYLDSTKKK
jgi:hypothetical protein